MRRLLPGLAVVAATLAVATPAARADVSVQYFTLPPELKGVTNGLDVSPAGTVYFGSGDGFQATPPIGRLNAAQAVPGTPMGITGVETPDAPGCCASIFRDFSWSTLDNRLYWTRSDNLVGTLAGDTVTSAPVPAAPWGIVAAPDGGAWLTEYGSSNVGPAYVGNRLARVSSSLGLSEYPNLGMQTGVWDGGRYDAKPKGIAIAPDGKPWFAEADPGNPGYRLGTTGGALGYLEYRPCPTTALCSGSFTGTGLSDVAVAADGTVWYTNEIKKTIGRFVPGDNTYSEFALAGIDPALGVGTPRALRKAPDGAIWAAITGGFSAPGANAILRIAPSATPTVTTYKLGASLQPFEVAPAPNGDVWFTGSPATGNGPIGRLTGSVTPDPDPTPTPTPTPDPGTGGGGGGANVNVTVNTPVTVNVTQTAVTAVTVGTARVTDPTVRGDAINANQICVGPPEDRCSLVYLIQTHEYVRGFPNTNGYIAAAKKLTTIGTAKVTLKGGQSTKVTVKLNRKGRKLLKKIKKFKATFTVTQSQNGKKPKTILKKSVRFKK